MFVPRHLTRFLLFAIALSSCALPAIAQPIVPGADQPALPVDPDTPRAALFAEVDGDVTRADDGADFVPAAAGDLIGLGGQARTGLSSRARIDLTPEMTIVRMAPQTIFTLSAFSETAAAPQTTLSLLFGQLWVILNGGNLEIETDTGLATVQGSMMSVAYDPDTGDMTVACLEGRCTLGNDRGIVDLVGGQASEIPGRDAAPNPPRPIRDEELREWRAEMPESAHPPQDRPEDDGALPPDGAFNEPITYVLTNECWAAWHWTFEGEGSYSVDVPPGETVRGEIPPGIYKVHDWADDGFDNGTYEVVGGTHLDPTYHCLDREGDPPPP